MNRKKRIIFGIVAAVLVLILAKGVFMRLTYALYQGEGISFQYPKDWTLRESRGSTEKYFQVHMFGKIDKKIGFGPSVTLTVYPKKAEGGRFQRLEELVADYRKGIQRVRDYAALTERATKLADGLTATDIEMSFVLRLPLYQVSAKDVPIRERALFFEKGQDLYILSYKNLASDYPSSASVFENIVKTLRFEIKN
jgi:hypothetical protein